MTMTQLTVGGTKIWHNDANQFHREDGPAYESSTGYKAWYINGERHREDGPAVEWSNGGKEWFYHGKYIKCKSNEEFLKLIKMKAFW